MLDELGFLDKDEMFQLKALKWQNECQNLCDLYIDVHSS